MTDCSSPSALARASADEVEPAPLGAFRQFVRESIGGLTETHDRRGFSLQHWPALRANAAGKPIELSLEHEARLRPTQADSLPRLLRHLGEREGCPLFDGGPGLTVRRRQRASGSQSVDRYWDVEGRLDGGWMRGMRTFRQRVRTSSFMSWSGGGPSSDETAFNLELPPMALGTNGILARLEFNWIEALSDALPVLEEMSRTGVGDPRHPLILAFQGGGLAPPGILRPALEHTTFREKYLLCVEAGGEATERFHLNVDHMTVQSLTSGHFAQHGEVDLAAAVPVDAAVLKEMAEIAAALCRCFALVPANATKAWRDVAALGRLG